MKTKENGWKFETCDGKDGFEFNIKGNKKAVDELTSIMNRVERDMKEQEDVELW